MTDRQIDRQIDRQTDRQTDKVSLRLLSPLEISKAMHSFYEYNYSNDFDLVSLIDKYQKYAIVVGAYSNERLLGFIAYYRNDNNAVLAYISMVVVNPQFRRQGIATRIMQYVIDDCKSNSYQLLKLEVDNHNEKAIHLYKKLGFCYETKASENSSYYTLIL